MNGGYAARLQQGDIVALQITLDVENGREMVGLRVDLAPQDQLLEGAVGQRSIRGASRMQYAADLGALGWSIAVLVIQEQMLGTLQGTQILQLGCLQPAGEAAEVRWRDGKKPAWHDQ